MKKLRARIVTSFLSNDFSNAETMEQRRERLRRVYNPGRAQHPLTECDERFLTVASAGPVPPMSNLKRELVQAGFEPGDEVWILGAGASPTQSKPLEFRELEVGDHFIVFPTDGDDSGHGGYRRAFWLGRKTRPCSDDGKDNYVCIHDGSESCVPAGLQVIKIGM